MSRKRFSKSELYYLRNNVPVFEVIKKLDIPFKISEGYTRFLCPACKEFNTSVYFVKNLARCFLCNQNYNTIDLVKEVNGGSFIESVNYLKALPIANPPSSVHSPRSTPQKRSPSKSLCSIKEIMNAAGFPLKRSPENNSHQPTISHNELLLKVNTLEQIIKKLTSKIELIEQQLSKM